MRQFLLRTNTAILLLLVVTGASGQLVIEGKDFPADYRVKQPVERVYTMNTASVATPKEGQNQTWDYSAVNVDRFTFLTYQKVTSSDPFKDATYKRHQIRTLANFPFRTVKYSRIDNDGSRDLGRVQFDTTHSLAMVTGNPSDEANIPNSVVTYDDWYDLIRFPVKYGDKWDGTGQYRVPFTLTIAAFGLNKTPFYLKQRRFVKREVVGEGKMRIPAKSGQTSRDIEVLMIKFTNVYMDSVFVGDGSLAPAALMAAFGFAQGDTATNETGYFFITKGFGFSVADIDLDDEGNVDFIAFTSDANSIGVNTNEYSLAHAVYPTVARAGNAVQFSLDNQKITAVQLFDAGGRQHQLLPLGEGKFELPISASPGVYFYHLELNGGKNRASGKILITD